MADEPQTAQAEPQTGQQDPQQQPQGQLDGQPAGTPQGEPAGQPEPQEPRFTQEEVNRILARETSKLERKYDSQIQELRQQIAQPQAQPQKGEPQQSGQEQASPQVPDEVRQRLERLDRLESEFSEEKSRRQFYEEVAGKGLTKAQTEKLYRLAKAEQPEDLGSWVDDTAKALGIQPGHQGGVLPQQGVGQQTGQSAPQTQQPQSQEPAPQQPPAGAAPNPPPDASVDRGTKKPWELTREEMNRMGGPREALNYWRKYARQGSAT